MMDDTRETTLIRKVTGAADGKTDPGQVSVARLTTSVLKTLTDSQKDLAARLFVRDLLLSAIRSNVYDIERRATRPPEPGRYHRHGTRKAYNKGCRCDECVGWKEWSDELDERTLAKKTGAINQLIDEFTATLRLEWTQELLESGFALGDGTTVTWGQATVAQHKQRITLLTNNAMGNLETASRHLAAVKEIESTQTMCLSEAVNKGVRS